LRRCELRLRWILALVVLTLALALAACGGGGDDKEKETPVATKTVEAEETQKPAETPKPEKTAEPSGGGGASLGDVPVYPGAEKTGDFSGDYSLPLLGQGLDVEEYKDTEWATYETSDSVDDVAAFYEDKMAANGWEKESWFDTSLGDGAAVGGFTRNDGDTAAWVVVTGNGDQTEIVLGTGSR